MPTFPKDEVLLAPALSTTFTRESKSQQPSWGYPQQAIDLMLQEIRRDPEHVIDSMRAELSKRKSREKEGR